MDSIAGFYFHVRGIQRKPGGWRLPVANIVMGPPVFAPLPPKITNAQESAGREIVEFFIQANNSSW